MEQVRKYRNEVGLVPRFFLGVVEDDDDPKHRGRLRVRVIGLHTEVKEETKKEGIETEHLLWAERINSPYGSSMTGQGWWGATPLPGSIVYLFFLDGNELQKPVYFGTLSGNPIDPPTGEQGFEDPIGFPEDKLWPREDRLSIRNGKQKGDPSFHLDEERKELSENYIDVRKLTPSEEYDGTGLENAIGIALSDNGWSESYDSGGIPDARYNFTYEGYPRDWSSGNIFDRNGIVLEIDSTSDYERFVVHHRTGTYFEITPDGKWQQKIRADRDHIVTGNDQEYVKGNQSVTIDGIRYLLIAEDSLEEFKASITQEVADKLEQKIGSKKYTEVPDQTHEISGKHRLDSDSNSRKVNNFYKCPFLKMVHSTQSKTYCSP